MSCGVGRRHGLDPTLLWLWLWLWLWHRSAAAALIQPLAWEPPTAAGAALKRKKILQRVTLKFNLNSLPTGQDKGRWMDGYSHPHAPGQGVEGPHPGSPAGSQRRGAPWRRAEVLWAAVAKAGFRYVPGSAMRAACILSHLISPRNLQANSTVTLLRDCRKRRRLG